MQKAEQRKKDIDNLKKKLAEEVGLTKEAEKAGEGFDKKRAEWENKIAERQRALEEIEERRFAEERAERLRFIQESADKRKEIERWAEETKRRADERDRRLKKLEDIPPLPPVREEKTMPKKRVKKVKKGTASSKEIEKAREEGSVRGRIKRKVQEGPSRAWETKTYKRVKGRKEKVMRRMRAPDVTREYSDLMELRSMDRKELPIVISVRDAEKVERELRTNYPEVLGDREAENQMRYQLAGEMELGTKMSELGLTKKEMKKLRKDRGDGLITRIDDAMRDEFPGQYKKVEPYKRTKEVVEKIRGPRAAPRPRRGPAPKRAGVGGSATGGGGEAEGLLRILFILIIIGLLLSVVMSIF